MRTLSCAVAGLLMVVGSAGAQTVWTGPEIEFVKPDGADWNLPENQDRITDNVWLTRQDRQGLFNINQEPGFNFSGSPIDFAGFDAGSDTTVWCSHGDHVDDPPAGYEKVASTETLPTAAFD